MTKKELTEKIESLGVVTEDKMFIKYSSDGILDLYTLIQEERKEAVEGLLNKCCNKCRDLLYSNYALQGQEKKKRSVEKLVREK